jgi:formylglycine-generating enzyme required for sulfatase activity
VWIAPDSIQPSVPWVNAIDRGLGESGIYVVVLTPSSVQSKWVQTETRFAIAEHQRGAGRLLPVLARQCDVRQPSNLLTTLHYVDFEREYALGLGDMLRALGAPGASVSGPTQAVAPSAVESSLGRTIVESAPPTPATDALLINLPDLGFRLELARVPAGQFRMGSDQAKDKDAQGDEQPQHAVELSEFCIGKTPVTVAQFATFTRATNYATTAEQEGSALIWNGKKWEEMKGATWQHPRGPKSDVTKKQDHR